MVRHDTGGQYLQWTEIGPSCPNCSLVLWTWPIKSMNPSPDLGTPCSGQSVNWNCLTVLDWPSCKHRGKHTMRTEKREAEMKSMSKGDRDDGHSSLALQQEQHPETFVLSCGVFFQPKRSAFEFCLP